MLDENTAIDIERSAILAALTTQGEAVVVIYSRAEVWKSRKEAVEFYTDAVRECEGAEKARYANILADLIAGETICKDGVTRRLTQPIERR